MLGTLYIYLHVYNNVRDKKIVVHTARCISLEECDNEINEFIGTNEHIKPRYLEFTWVCSEKIFPKKE